MMYSGDEIYDDEVTSGLDDFIARRVDALPEGTIPPLAEFVERALHDWEEEQRSAYVDRVARTYAETSPGYRQAMTDAGRGSMLR